MTDERTPPSDGGRGLKPRRTRPRPTAGTGATQRPAGATGTSDATEAAGDATVERLAETLKLHAQSEEEVFYPAALLVGDVVRARSATGTNQR